ncbi:toprim domain-containing protein [Flavobacterium columnare]|nr:toprim domain-containing protein [Flavobacterium columnare]
MAENYSLIACFGTNGLNEEILNAIKELKQLEEIIFAFDNDTAGKEAILKYGKLLQEEIGDSPTKGRQIPRIKISVLEPINKDINETLQAHNEEIFTELLDKRQPFIFSSEKKIPRSEQEEKPSNAIDFLKRSHLIKNLNELIGKSGIVGEEKRPNVTLFNYYQLLK